MLIAMKWKEEVGRLGCGGVEGRGDLSVKHKAHWSHFQARQGRGVN